MGEVSATQAGLRIGGADLDPTEISELVGCQPTRSHAKGDRISPTGETLWKKGIWIVASEWERGDQLDSQIRKILSSLTTDVETWKAISERFDVDMYCGVELEETNLGMGLEFQTMKMLSDRQIKLELDIYHVGPTSGE